jgi:hypothetical protein
MTTPSAALHESADGTSRSSVSAERPSIRATGACCAIADPTPGARAAPDAFIREGAIPLVARVGQIDGKPECQLPFTLPGASMQVKHVDPSD